jgi:ABC-2 type transport system permease protein
MNTSVTTMQIIKTQIKRELWENKTGFIKTPWVVTSVLLILVLSATTYSLATNSSDSRNINAMHFECTANNCSVNNNSPAVGDNSSHALVPFGALSSVASDPRAFNNMILGVMYGNCMLLSVIFSIVLSTYVLRCLFDDRKNKEILFWRSMPVSETINVLVKLGMQILAAPLILLASNIVVIVVLFLMGFIVFWVCGVPVSYLVTSFVQGNTYFIPLQIFFENIFGFLMLLPVIGYFLLASALAKKSPFFTGAIIPGVLMIADVVLHKLIGINFGFMDSLGAYAKVLYRVKDTYILQHALIVDVSMLWPFIVCVTIGSLFVAAAIWLRNNRYEI